MNKIIRCRNTNSVRIVILAALQVLMGVFPVLLLILFVWLKLYNIKITAIIVIILIFLCNVVYAFLVRRYNALTSGRRGEKLLYKTVRHLGGNNIIFCNLPIRYKRGRSETDMLIISRKGVIIIEVKNHSGTIQGSWKSEKWTQRKFYRDKTTDIEMDNPIKQMRRQRDIVKSILNAAGEDVWIDTVLYFSNENAKLRLDLRKTDYVCLGSRELMHFLENYENDKTLTREQMEKYAKILNDARSEV